ncbi:hypothetical protein APHACPA_0047 [Rickettsia amblyommatis str. Ac/Pa]|uniref:Uncharacterized protein n=1 Tax=Rickettsia amblyommatis str. Ac/Pa TaxID=1359164 RepID=A0A0F3MZ78_RICAM|nr:hypothetical protein APHACPA_0047 [Rickettsia amblyommatis str. Ac/Pa]
MAESYLDKVIEDFKALTDTNDTFLKEACYKKIALIQKDIKEGEYPWYVAPFNKIDHASLLLTNIHILELDYYLNQNTVKAVKICCEVTSKIYIIRKFILLLIMKNL